MSLHIKEREKEYFNDTDVFICYDEGINNWFLSKMEFYNGYWWTLESLKYKATTIYTQNYNEVYRKPVKMKGIEHYGIITNELIKHKCLGIVCQQGKQNKINGLANFWTNLNNLDYEKD